MTEKSSEELLNDLIKSIKCDTNLISDGYHTFGELYEHRIVIYIALCRFYYEAGGNVWKSKKHSDGSEWDSWFLLGINRKTGTQITYHLPISKWDECKFQEFEQAPKYDGHTSADVLKRISEL